MNMAEYRAYCQSMNGAIESLPIDQSTLVFKVIDKNIVKELIDHWYDLVMAKLPKKRKEDLNSFK